MSIKPSHLLDPVERMDMAELLSTIVERACFYVPGPKEEFTKALKFPKEAPTDSEKAYPKEALTRVEKVSVDASDFVRYI